MEKESLIQQVDEKVLIERAQKNDEAAVAEMIRRYSKLAKSISHLYFIPGGEKEDLEQEALIGLHESIMSYDSKYNTPFVAFATLCIKRELITAVKNANRKKHEILNKSSSIDDKGHDLDRSSLLGLLPSEDNNPEDIVLHSENESFFLETLYKSLSPLEKAVLERRMEGHSYSSVAIELGRSLKAIDNAVHRIRLKASKIQDILVRNKDS